MKNKGDIIRELEHAPLLKEAKNQLNESVPSTYFEELTNSVIHQSKGNRLTDIKDELQTTIPDGYFDNLSEEVLKEVNPPRKRSFGYWKIAASIALILGVAIFMYLPNTEETLSHEIDIDSLTDYMALNIDDIDDELLLSEWETTTNTSVELDEAFLDDLLLEDLL